MEHYNTPQNYQDSSKCRQSPRLPYYQKYATYSMYPGYLVYQSYPVYVPSYPVYLAYPGYFPNYPVPYSYHFEDESLDDDQYDYD